MTQARDDRYIALWKRLEPSTSRAAMAICLMIVLECATSWRRLLIAIGLHIVVFPVNLLITRFVLPRLGAKTEVLRTIVNTGLCAVGYHWIDWPLAVWLWLPYAALAFDEYGGKYSLVGVLAMCTIQGGAAIFDGVSPEIPIVFTLLALMTWHISSARVRVMREMLTEAEDNQRALERAIEARREAERELVAVSRRAGMAQIATGVLHDVGNVLNSLNVSIVLAAERLNASKLDVLERTVALYENDAGGLRGLLASRKGDVVPQVIAGVTRRLRDDEDWLRGELAAVANHVDHIKTIVAAQQSYARVSSIHEAVRLDDVLESALAIGSSSLQQEGVEIERDYADVPEVRTDPHKLLQILVNLVTNAGQAVHSQGGRVTLRVGGDGDKVVVRVEDTGVGMSPENLDSVFQHGFTTKPTGHGFGLHTCANLARDLGGSLAAASAGPGKGSTFTLELPTTRVEP